MSKLTIEWIDDRMQAPKEGDSALGVLTWREQYALLKAMRVLLNYEKRYHRVGSDALLNRAREAFKGAFDEQG